MRGFNEKEKEWLENNLPLIPREDLAYEQYPKHSIVTIRKGKYVHEDNFWYPLKESVIKTGVSHPMFKWLARLSLEEKCKKWEFSYKGDAEVSEKFLEDLVKEI